MARINLKNLTTKTLISMSQDELLALAKRGLNQDQMKKSDYAKAHRSNLANITSRLVSTANRRIKQLGKTEIGRISPAYQRATKMSKSGLFSVKGRNWNDLLNTLKETKEFLSSETSTVKGWQNVRSQIEANLGGELSSVYKSKKFWKAYRKLSELNGGIMARKGSTSRLSSDRVQKMLYSTITEKRDKSGKRVIDWRNRVDKIVKEANKEVEEAYKLEQKSDVGTSRNFIK